MDVMKSCGGAEVQLHARLTSAVHAEERANSSHYHATSRESAACTYSSGECVGAGASLDDLEKKTFRSSVGNRTKIPRLCSP